MLKIINYYYYNINNNILISNRVKTLCLIKKKIINNTCILFGSVI